MAAVAKTGGRALAGCGVRPGGDARKPLALENPTQLEPAKSQLSDHFLLSREAIVATPYPTPRHLRLIKGNPGKRPIRADEPQPRPGRPSMPRHLTKHGREAWRRFSKLLADIGVLSPADGPALERMAEAYAAGIEARESLDRAVRVRGIDAAAGQPAYTSAGADGVLVRRRPELALIADADRRLLAYLCHFGMTPAARSKVAVASGPGRDDPAARYFD